MTNPTPPNVASDAFFSTDPQVLAIEIGDRAGIAFSGTPGPFHLSIETMIEAAFEVRERELKTRLDAAESQLASLKGRATESDRECADRIANEAQMMLNVAFYDRDIITPIIAAHVASRTAKLRERLTEAEGLLKDILDACAGADSPAAKNVKLGTALGKTRTFLTSQDSEREGER